MLALLPQHLFCCASEQDESCFHDVKDQLRPREQRNCNGKSSTGSRKTEGNETLCYGKETAGGIEKTLPYMDFPTQQWSRIRTNKTIECLNRENKRRTQVTGAFPDGQSALMLVYARFRHVARTQ